jgi:hypothetical protein
MKIGKLLTPHQHPTPENQSRTDHSGALPSSTLAPSSFSHLSEEAILKYQLEAPLLKMGNQSDSSKKSGSMPFDPDVLRIVTSRAFEDAHNNYFGSQLSI